MSGANGASVAGAAVGRAHAPKDLRHGESEMGGVLAYDN